MLWRNKDSLSKTEAAGRQNIYQAWSLRTLSSSALASRVLFVGLIVVFLFITGVSVVTAVKWVGQTFAGFLITPRVVVANVGQHYWSGMIAGLKYPDKILTANGRNLSSIADLKAVIRATKTGDSILFKVEREGKTFELAIPTMRFTWLDLTATFGVELFSGLAFMAIGIVVFILKPDAAISWSFLLLCAFLWLYNITDFDKGSTGFARFYMLAMTFIPAAGLHLSFLFPERKKFVDRFPYLNMVPYGLSASLFIPLVILYPKPAFRPFYQLSLLYLIVAALGLALSTLQSYLKSSSVLARQRGKVVLFGAALAFPLPAAVHYVSMFGGTATNLAIVSNYLPLPIIIFPLSIAYAIARHNLFDVDVYIKRTVGYVIMTAVVGMGYFSIQSVTTTLIFKPLFGEYTENVFPIVFALLVVFFFNPINGKVQEAVDTLFFRKKLDYKETVRKVSSALTSLLNLEQILERVVQTVRQEMFIDTVGLVVLEPQKRRVRTFFVGDKEPGATTNGRRDLRLTYDDPLLTLLTTEKRLITKYDIEEDLRYGHLKEACGKSFAELDASVAVPMVYQGEVTGVLALGNKKSGHFYTREEIELLDTMADEAAVAIENAKLAEQMKKEESVRANLSRYLSPQIVDQIVKQDVQVNLGGDKKVVTVLFSDIRNFTGITETQRPDKLARLLNEYFTEMAGIIFENQGSLDKYIGDAIVAVFGSLIDLENSAQNAARAAAQMMRRVTQLNERWQIEYGFEMQIGIGLNTGEVFLGNIGSPERMEFTVIGDTVNVASRFSGLAKSGQILMTQETMSRLGPEIRYNDLSPTEIKGKSDKLAVFELLS